MELMKSLMKMKKKHQQKGNEIFMKMFLQLKLEIPVAHTNLDAASESTNVMRPANKGFGLKTAKAFIILFDNAHF